MNKEIEKIALEVANETIVHIAADDPTSKYQITHFATRFLARVDAERAKEAPVTWMFTDNEDNNHTSFRQIKPTPKQVEYLAKCGRPSWKPLYLHPQSIPEGYKLVPIEPTKDMYAAGEDTFVSGYTGTPISTPGQVWEAMLAAAPEVKP